MLDIDNNGNIKVNKGDAFQLPLFIDIGDDIFHSTRFTFRENDVIYFRVLEGNMPCECPLISKELHYQNLNENGDIIVSFDSDDTNWLFSGIYFYEVKLKRPAENTDEKDTFITIIPRRKLIIQ